MGEKPILFSAPMIRAILDGRKSQTRRVLKPQPGIVGGPFYRPSMTQPNNWHSVSKTGIVVNVQKVGFAEGDQLWVREAWRTESHFDKMPMKTKPTGALVAYEAGADYRPADVAFGRLRTPRFMPRWASRITLRVTGVKVERLQDISAADTIAEGVQCDTCFAMGKSACNRLGCFASRQEFQDLWESINGEGSWEANPWVAAISFERVK